MEHEFPLRYPAAGDSLSDQGRPLVQEQGESNRSELPAKPTPLPWRQRFADVNGQRFPQTVIEDASGNPVAQVYWHKSQRDWTQTADRIVRSVNTHADLLILLVSLLAYADGIHRAEAHAEGREVDYVTFPEVRAAIERATS